MCDDMTDFFGGNVIFSYTRADAIRDGVLVDLSQGEMGKLCKQAGFKVPIAMTATAFGETITAGAVLKPTGEFDMPEGQSVIGRLWDVLFLLRSAVGKALRKGEKTDRVYFTVAVDDGEVTGPDGRKVRRRRDVEMYCVLGPGDQGEPVMTAMLVGED